MAESNEQIESARLIAQSMYGDPQVFTGVCETHGGWSLNTYVGIPDRVKTCPGCVADVRARKEAEESAAKAKASVERRIGRLIDCGVNERHQDKTFDVFVAETAEQANALNRCKLLVDGILDNPKRKPSLVLLGNPGTGKSHLACSMVIALSDAGVNAYRVCISDLVRDFKNTYGKRDSEETESDLLRFYGRVPLLVIEEIGVQFGSDTERMYLFEVMNRRYENCLPTVFVSNLDAAKLTAEVGERVIDRLREDGGTFLLFRGESWRKK